MTQTATTIVPLQEEPRSMKVRVDDLISLDQTGIPYADLALRPLSEKHIQSLMHSDISTWPAIKLTRANIGDVLIDGYHRREAAMRKGEPLLDAVLQSYATVEELIEEAFRSDFRHGLRPSDERRGDYAFFLRYAFPNLKQEEIADRVGMSQPAVSKAIAKIEAALRDAELEEEVRKQFDTERACKQFSSQVIRFIRGVEDMSDDDLIRSIRGAVKQKDREKLVRVAQLLLQVSEIQR